MARKPSPSARKDWVFFGVFWVLITIIGELMVFKVHLLPTDRYAREAEIGDDAYKLLIKMAVPIFAGVVAMLLTILLRQIDRRTSEEQPSEDGPALQPQRGLVPVWLVITGALALLLAIDPGFTGLREIRGSSKAEYVIEVQAQRWSWSFTYPEGAVTTEELVLPEGARVRFDITSVDIVHSFWIPAFRIKLDAVPGRTTQLYITPEATGNGADDSRLRVQCAELCGINHTTMAVPVRIIDQDEFDAWLTENAKGN